MTESALVTGAASGIGGAIAERLVSDGWDVLAVDLAPDDDGPGAPFAADLTTREGNRSAVDAALERFGRLDAVIPNAGFQHVSPIETFDEDRWDALVALLRHSVGARLVGDLLLDERRSHVAGTDGARADPDRRSFERERLHQPHDPVLRRHVARLER